MSSQNKVFYFFLLTIIINCALIADVKSYPFAENKQDEIDDMFLDVMRIAVRVVKNLEKHLQVLNECSGEFDSYECYGERIRKIVEKSNNV